MSGHGSLVHGHSRQYSFAHRFTSEISVISRKSSIYPKRNFCRMALASLFGKQFNI